MKQWKSSPASGPGVAQAFVPLAFPPGEACQFDWSHEVVELGGTPQTVKLAHFRLAYTRLGLRRAVRIPQALAHRVEVLA